MRASDIVVPSEDLIDKVRSLEPERGGQVPARVITSNKISLCSRRAAEHRKQSGMMLPGFTQSTARTSHRALWSLGPVHRMNIASMESLSPVIAASAAHVIFRSAYFFYIGFTLRSVQLDQNKHRANRYNEWLRFKNKASFILNGDAVSFALIILLSIGSLPPLIPYEHTMIVGLAFACIGIAVKLVAYRLVGNKGYYWYNFFCPVEEREYTATGIYRYLDNPMYGLGYMHAFGLALIFRSVWGIIFALFDWVVIWTFYFSFERSHTLRNRNSVRSRSLFLKGVSHFRSRGQS